MRMVIAVAFAVLATEQSKPLSGQEPVGTNEPGEWGVSLGLFSFLPGAGPGIVLDQPLNWNKERQAAVEGWLAVLPGNGVATAAGLHLGAGVIRGGVGAMIFRGGGDFGLGPGFEVGVGTPKSGRESFQLRGSFQAYFTTLGYVPSFRVVLGRWARGSPARS